MHTVLRCLCCKSTQVDEYAHTLLINSIRNYANRGYYWHSYILSNKRMKRKKKECCYLHMRLELDNQIVFRLTIFIRCDHRMNRKIIAVFPSMSNFSFFFFYFYFFLFSPCYSLTTLVCTLPLLLVG